MGVAVCTFETIQAADVLSALQSMRGNFGRGILIPPPGDGPDKSLNWAIGDVMNAEQEQRPEERERLCTAAIVHARRALSCLVDWYLERDLIKFCRLRSSDAQYKAGLLISRGIIDALTSRVLARAINERNQVEHDYTTPSLETAENCVELWRRTMAAIRSQSPPSNAPFIFGIVHGGISVSEKGPSGIFNGWVEPLLVLWRFQPRPWVGILHPDDDTNATVRRAFLDQVLPEQLIEILGLAEQKFGKPSGFSDPITAEVCGKSLSLS